MNLLSQDDIDNVYSPKLNRKWYVRPLRKGQIACCLAHVNAWKAIVEQDLDYAVVLEDDAQLNKNFSAALKFLDDTYGQWDFVRIQENSKLKKVFCEKNMGDFSFVQYINTSGDVLGQAISGVAAKKMLNELLSFGLPVDVNQQYYYQIGVRVDSLRPPIVVRGELAKESVKDSPSSGYIHYKSHYPFVRAKLSLDFYTRRIFRLIKEYGFLFVLKNMLALSFRKSVK